MFFRILFSAMLGVIWMLLMSEITFPMFVVGLLVGFGLTYLYDIIAGKDIKQKKFSGSDLKRVFKNIPNATVLTFVFIWELLKANIAVLAAVFGPKEKLKPGIIAMSIDLKSDVDIMMLANMITLTPGTITVEVSRDNKTLYIHALDDSDPEGVIDGINKAFADRLKKGEEL